MVIAAALDFGLEASGPVVHITLDQIDFPARTAEFHNFELPYVISICKQHAILIVEDARLQIELKRLVPYGAIQG